MGMPDRPSLARILALSVALSALPLTAPAAGAAGPAPAPAERARPAARQDAFVPGRVLVGFEAGAGEQGRRTAAAAVDGRVVAGTGRTRVVELDRGADVRAAARRLADRPGWPSPSRTGSAGSTPATPRSAGTSSPARAPTWSRPTT